MCALLAAGSVLAFGAPAAWLDWQPALAWGQPWRWVSAAWVHWSPLHLVANLAGIGVVAWLGSAARLPPAAALAFAGAWPLTHGGLLAQPALAHYGGASGVLHAAVAVAACWLVVKERGRVRWLGAFIGAGLVAKLALEAPWGDTLVRAPGWDIAISPWAHASGAVMGGLSAALVLALRRHRA